MPDVNGQALPGEAGYVVVEPREGHAMTAPRGPEREQQCARAGRGQDPELATPVRRDELVRIASPPAGGRGDGPCVRQHLAGADSRHGLRGVRAWNRRNA